MQNLLPQIGRIGEYGGLLGCLGCRFGGLGGRRLGGLGGWAATTTREALAGLGLGLGRRSGK